MAVGGVEKVTKAVSASSDEVLAPSLDPADIAHREEFRRYVLQRAEEWHRRYLSHLYERWEQWKGDDFGGEMNAPYIMLGEPSAPQRYGDCSKISCWGGRSQIRIRPSLLRRTHPRIRPEGEF